MWGPLISRPGNQGPITKIHTTGSDFNIRVGFCPTCQISIFAHPYTCSRALTRAPCILNSSPLSRTEFIELSTALKSALGFRVVTAHDTEIRADYNTFTFITFIEFNGCRSTKYFLLGPPLPKCVVNWGKGFFCVFGLKLDSVAMAKPEITSEVPCRGRKRESSEDAIINESSEYESYDSGETSDFSIDYDSDDPSFEILEGKPDGKIWKQYYKEWEESEGFDVSVHPGTSFMAGLVQLDDYRRDPKIKEEYTELCKLAIDDFNSKNDDKMYVFEEIVNVNATYAAGTWFYFTFNARDTTVDATDADAIKAFQANVWHGFDGTTKVSLCRLKKFLSNEDKKKKKKKKKCQQDGKAEVEQDKPSLVESFVPGLVIEELSKGKPGRKKAYVGFKVAVRYTGKLKENDKIFETNIGEEKPLEFRIAAGKTIQGLEMGVTGMRVGDKRRITIPPDMGYGAKGHRGVVPPNAWLVFEVELVDIIYNSA